MEGAMSQNKKIVLFIVVPVVAICCLLCVITAVLIPRAMSNAIADDPTKSKQIGVQIADYTLPRGYQEEMGVDMYFEQIVSLARSDKRGVTIALIQVKTNADRQQMEQQLQQAFQNQAPGSYAGMQYVGTRTVTIKGQPTVLTISETSDGSGDLRQATGSFVGKGGVAMVMVMGDVSEWDWNMLDSFFQSIR
jgi:hypothetical protein